MPIGTTLWTPIAGDVTFEGIYDEVCREFPIKLKRADNLSLCLTAEGSATKLKGAEPLLFPSKDQRDWQVFVEQLANEPDEPTTIIPNGMEKLDLTKILKNVPIGTKLYSTVHGEVEFCGIKENPGILHPICVTKKRYTSHLARDGRYNDAFDGECILFPAKDQRDWQVFVEQLANEPDEPRTILPNGVYIVYADGHYERYRNGLKRDEGMRVGISWDGHTWILGKDYGDLPWSTASREKLEDNTCRIMKEYEAVLDWDFWGARSELIGLWDHIPFADDETMPTCPMVLVQEHLATQSCLNDALRFCCLPEYEVERIRWFVERSSAYGARTFSGGSGYLYNNGVNSAARVQAVTLWNID